MFSAVGYADTHPLETSISPKDPANRRVEILILKNKYKNQFSTRKDFTLNLSKAQQDRIQRQRAEIIKNVEGDSISLAAKKLLEENRRRMERQKNDKLSKKNKDLYINLNKETTNFDRDLPKVEKRVIKTKSILRI